MKSVVALISSVTGNTQMVADAVLEELASAGIEVSIFKNKELLELQLAASGSDCETAASGLNRQFTQKLETCDAVFSFFWCRKSSMDDLSKGVVKLLAGKEVLAFGTMGSYADGEYADLVRKNVTELIEEANICSGVFLCQGKIPVEKTLKRAALPKDNPHYLDEEGVKRHVASRSHPDTVDLANAKAFVRKTLELR